MTFTLHFKPLIRWLWEAQSEEDCFSVGYLPCFLALYLVVFWLNLQMVEPCMPLPVNCHEWMHLIRWLFFFFLNGLIRWLMVSIYNLWRTSLTLLFFSFPCPFYQNVPLSLALSPRIISEVAQFKPDIIHSTSPGIMVRLLFAPLSLLTACLS